MPNQVEIVVTGRDAGATKVLDNVTASSRAAAKQAAETAKAEQLAAEVMQKAGGTVSEASLRMVKARDEERRAAQELAKVQANVRKNYYDEADAARVTAAAMENLAKAKMHVAAISAAPPPRVATGAQAFEGAAQAIEKRELASQIGTHDFLRERMNERLGEFGITESMGGMTAAVAGGAAVLGELANKMREAVAESLEFGEAMSRAAAKTGLSVETLSVLHFAAKTTGGDFDSMTAAVAKMDKTIAQASEGNKKAEAFMKALGLNATDLAGRQDGAEIAFQKFAATLAATESPIRRVELATALLGKAGAEQIPTLIELGQHMEEFRAGAERTGNMLDEKTAAALVNTQHKLKELGQEATGVGLAFTEGFLPALDQLLDVVSGGTDKMQPFKVLGEDIGRVFEFAAGRLYDAASAAAALASVAAGGPFSQMGKNLSGMADEFAGKAAKLEHGGLFGGKTQPTQGEQAFKAGLGATPGGESDPVLDAIRKRNAARTEGFQGVGDITGNPDQKRLKAMEAALNEEKLQFGMSVRAESDYWTAKQDAFAKGSAEYDAILAKRTALAMQAAPKDAELIKRFKEQQLQRDRLQSPVKPGEDPLLAMHRDEARAQESRFDSSNELYALQQRVAMRQAEMAVQQEAGRTITQEAAAMQIAAIHTAAYGAELERLEAKRRAIAENPLLSNGEADQQRKIDELTRRIAELQGGRELEIQQDSYAVKNADQSAVKGATDALHEFRMEALDTARQMHELVSSFARGVNEQLLNAITGQKTDFRGVGEQAARGVADMGLKKMESNALDAARPVLDKFGLGGLFGGGKKDGSSEASALWVRPVGDGGATAGAGGMSELSKVLSIGLPGMPEYKGGGDSGVGTLIAGLGKFAMPMLPGFADGVEDFSGGPAWVGERGPEILNLPRGSSVTPNHAIGAGGDGGDQHLHFDLRGANDPAAIEAATRRGIAAAAPHIAAAGARAVQERRMRLPTMRR